MARKMKDLYTYPQAYLDVAGEAFEKKQIAAWPMADKAAATSTIHSFNRFRVALALSGHPHASATNDLIVRKVYDTESNQWGVYFVPRGLWKKGEELADLVFPTAETQHASAVAIDNTEALLEKMLRGGEKEEVAEKPTPSCLHEWSMYDVCLKCGEPK